MPPSRSVGNLIFLTIEDYHCDYHHRIKVSKWEGVHVQCLPRKLVFKIIPRALEGSIRNVSVCGFGGIMIRI